MQYTLITPQGKIYQFFLKQTAVIWQQAYGGTVIDNSVVQKDETIV